MREDWIVVELGEVCERSEKAKRKGMLSSSTFKYFDIGGIDNKTNLITGFKEYSWGNAPSRAQQIIKKGDVLFSTVRTYLRNIAQVDKNEYNNEICSSGFTVLRGKKGVLLSNFLFQYSLSIGFLNPLSELQTGSSYPAVRDKDVFAQFIPLPPLPIQRAIVQKIENLFASLDKGIADLKTAQEQLKVYRQAVLKKAFEGGFTSAKSKTSELGLKGLNDDRINNEEILQSNNPKNHNSDSKTDSLPEGWKWVKLGEVCEKIQDGTHFSPKYQSLTKEKNTYPYITSKNIRNGFMELSNITYVDEQFHNSIYCRCNPNFGDVLLTKDGVNTGNVTINTFKEPICLLSSVCLIKPTKVIDARFIVYYIQSPNGFKNLTGEMTGTAIKRIILKKIKNTVLPLPTLAEQHTIVREIESRLSVCDKVEQSINEALEKAEALRQSILKKAFEGKLLSEDEIAKCKQEADYEPASELLKRIKAEKK